MQFIRVGHATDLAHGTGVTAFVFDKPAVAAYVLCGSSPASLELPTLELDANVSHIDGILFLGGSAFGLGAVAGAMRYFKELKRGYPTLAGPVPIIPSAGIYDLLVTKPLPPTPDDVYQACQSAVENQHSSGRIGAGTGASIGKFVPDAKRMQGGLGYAELILPNGLQVMAYVVVNCLGDIRDHSGNIIAGAIYPNGQFANCEAYLLSGEDEGYFNQSNTTLVAVFTNAKCSKIELKRIAKVATAGMARAISPVFTRFDGDLLFCVSIGEYSISENVLGAMAAEAVRLAIINAVQGSTIIG